MMRGIMTIAPHAEGSKTPKDLNSTQDIVIKSPNQDGKQGEKPTTADSLTSTFLIKNASRDCFLSSKLNTPTEQDRLHAKLIRLKMISFSVKGNPKAQKRHRHVKSGWTYDPSAKEKQDFLTMIQQYAPKQPLSGAICLKAGFYLYPPKKWLRTGKHAGKTKDSMPRYVSKRPDIDNYLKWVMDAMGNGIFFNDDSQIAHVIATKEYSLSPRVEVEIDELLR
tara:strand:- start:1135 stop:1800 length:666 start_codon:yes stop_codon:yes gene_type:complete